MRPVDVVMYAFYAVLLALAVPVALGDVVRWVPLLLSVPCAVLWYAARAQLGTSFSVRPAARGLVTTGLYAHTRHPIYVYGTAAFLLVLLALQGWAALVIGAVLIPLQVVRARREERVLANAFGAEYDDYRRATRR